MHQFFKKNKIKKATCFLFCFILLFSFLLPLNLKTGEFLSVSAQTSADVDFGQEYAESTNLGNTDLRIILARFVQLALTFLAIIAVIMIIYAGFLWMTSNGQEDRITKARSVLKNAIIGLIIILSAFAIVSFVLNKIGDTIGGGGSGSGGGVGSGGFGAIGSCSVENVYPEPQQKDVPRNTSIIVTFKEAVNVSTIISGGYAASNTVEIYKSNDPVNKLTNVGATSTSDHKTFVFTPSEYLGSPTESIWYTVYLTNDILNMGGEGIFEHCYDEFLEWHFRVNTELDLTPPQVTTVFPPPDDFRDIFSTTQTLQSATGAILLNNNVDYYESATTTSAINPGGNVDSININSNSTAQGTLEISVATDGITATLEQTLGTNITSLGSAQFSGNSVTFSGFLTLNLLSPPSAGDLWTVGVDSVRQADTLTVGGDTYIFREGGMGSYLPNEIEVGASISNTVANIVAKLNPRSDIIAINADPSVNLEAEVGGDDGNNIGLSSNDSDGDISITSMHGGQDENISVSVQGRMDQYRNAIIQINFNETLNPIRLSGEASTLVNYIKIVNASTTALGTGAACIEDRQCISLNCDGGNCAVGDYLDGEFMVSNMYRTVEFRSNNQCGVNSCGQDVYCLPSNANLKVEFVAATLAGCGTLNCTNRSPYNICTSTPSHCADQNGINYPMGNFDGVVDICNNSLDGDRDNNAEGPDGFYDENGGGTPSVGADIGRYPTVATEDDSFAWSFWLNDEIKSGAPLIEAISPGDLSFTTTPSTSDFEAPIQIDFDILMRSGTLKTGTLAMDNGQEQIPHKGLNLWNYTGGGLGYWIKKEDVEDVPPIDGYPNRTNVFIAHSAFRESNTYRSQVGSGLNDIYQNCFKPSGSSVGVCSGVGETNPSCCNGTITGVLNSNGNCN